MNENATMNRLRAMAVEAEDGSEEETALLWAVDRIEALEKFRVAVELTHEQAGRRITHLRAKIGNPLI